MTDLRAKLRDDPEYQIIYSHLRSSGVDKGHAGKDVYCDTTTAPQYGQFCRNGTLLGKKKEKDLFNRVSGPWKDLVHK